MARYTGPVCKICRREGTKLFLKGERCTTKCALDTKRGSKAPGQHGAAVKKQREYGMQLREKQKTKRYYGVLEKQFVNYFEEADRKEGMTGENLLLLIERRFDNVIYRVGLASSRKEARQLIIHGHFKVNDKKVNIPSVILKAGDVISVTDSFKASKKYTGSKKTVDDKEVVDRGLADSFGGKTLPKWLTVNKENATAKIVSLPTRDDIDIEINEQLIVELYSK